MTKKSNAGKFVLGAAVGAALGVLFAPKSGKSFPLVYGILQ